MYEVEICLEKSGGEFRRYGRIMWDRLVVMYLVDRR